MRCFIASRRLFAVCAGFLFVAGCGALQQAGVPAAVRSAHLLPQTSSQTLLYVTDAGGAVYVVSYPQGQLIGSLSVDVAQAVCSDQSGNVFVTAYNTEDVLEFAHGGTSPIAKLGDYGYYPLGCAVDPTTGNLAVANENSMNGSGGNVAIYKGASGKPVDYGSGDYYWCTYDGSGNLFVVDSGGGLHELPAGGTSLTNISLNVGGQGIQWDGKYLVMVSPTAKQVYRISVSGSSGTVVSTISFKGLITAIGDDFVLDGSTILMPYSVTREILPKIGLARYPQGGRFAKTIHFGKSYLYAVTLSS